MPKFISGTYRGTRYKIIPKPGWRRVLHFFGIVAPYFTGMPVTFEIVVTHREQPDSPALNALPLFVEYTGQDKHHKDVAELRKLSETIERTTLGGYYALSDKTLKYWINVPGQKDSNLIVSVTGHDSDAFYFMLFGAVISSAVKWIIDWLITLYQSHFR